MKIRPSFWQTHPAIRHTCLLGVLMVTYLSVALPNSTTASSYGFPVRNAVIDTADFMGQLRVDSAPWVFSILLDNWTYLPDPDQAIRDNHGIWLYALNQETDSWGGGALDGLPLRYGYPTLMGFLHTGQFLQELHVGSAPWVYSYRYGNWMYLGDPSENLKDGVGAWAYLLNAPIRISRFAAAQASHNSVRIHWESNRGATARLSYGPSETELDHSVEVSAEAETQHSYLLEGVEHGATYFYQIEVTDPYAETTTTEVLRFENNSRALLDQSWLDAWHSWDEPTIDAWYAENTGPGAIGIEESDLWVATVDGLTIDAAWLEANEGEHVYQKDGRWVVEGVQAGWFTIGARDVTLRGCLALIPSSTPTAGIQRQGSFAGNLLEVEYCHVRAAPDTSPTSRGIEGSDINVRNTEIGPGMTGTGLRMWGSNRVEYNFVHHLLGHHSGIGIRGSNAVVRRNYSETGTSASIFIYAHDSGAPSSGLTDILVEENYLNSPRAWYAMNPGGTANAKAQAATHVRVINNRWGTLCLWPGNQGDIGGSHHAWLGRIPQGQYQDDRNNIWGGNHWITSRNYIKPQTGQYPYDHPNYIYDDPYVLHGPGQ